MMQLPGSWPSNSRDTSADSAKHTVGFSTCRRTARAIDGAGQVWGYNTGHTALSSKKRNALYPAAKLATGLVL